MFCKSEQLKERIQIISDEIFLKSNGNITFEEYIALPYYGHIILRFNLNEENYTIEDLDRYESMMYECAKDEFLIDFMGNVYRNIGIDYQCMDELFVNCNTICHDEKICPSIYAQQIKEDAKLLLAMCELNVNLPVWEMQVEDEIHLFILGDENNFIGTYHHDGLTINVYHAAEKSCAGLISAAFYAKRKKLSLANVLMTVQNNN